MSAPQFPPAGHPAPSQPAAAMKNGLGTAALVLGILALVGSFIPVLGVASIPMGVLGALLAVLGLVRISKQRANNRGASIAGLVLSVLAIITAAIVTAVSASFVTAVDDAVNESGASEVTPEESQEPEESAPTQEESAPEQEAAEQQFPGQRDGDVVVEPGEPVSFGGSEVTAGELEQRSTPIGDYLCTEVEYDNGSDEQVSYSSLDWNLQEPGGSIQLATFTGEDDELSSGQLAPGGSVSGVVCWDLPSQDSGTFVVLAEGFLSLSENRGAWVNTL